MTLRGPVTADEISGFWGDATDYVGKRPLAWHIDPGAARPNILAFDVGKTTGWALLGGSGGSLPLRSFASFDGRGVIDAGWCGDVRVAMTLLDHLAGVDLVVVEDVFLHADPKKSNPVTMAHLAYYVGAVITVASRRNTPVLRVAPSSWQSKMLGKIRRDQGKRLSLLRARKEFGAVITNEHVADAALMALYMAGPLP